MKRMMALILAAVMLLAAGCAAAEQTVKLPESRYAVTLPDGMEFDGPGKMDRAAFVYVSEALGLDIVFVVGDANGLNRLEDLIPGLEEQGMEDVSVKRISGIDMVVYRYTPADPAEMKCVGYILRDGEKIEEIAFWYATKEAAKQTETIIKSIEDTGTV